MSSALMRPWYPAYSVLLLWWQRPGVSASFETGSWFSFLSGRSGKAVEVRLLWAG